MLSESEAASWKERGRKACYACLNPFEVGNAYSACLGAYLIATVPLGDDTYMLQAAMEFAWGWEWELQHFRDEWIGVPPEQRAAPRG